MRAEMIVITYHKMRTISFYPSEPILFLINTSILSAAQSHMKPHVKGMLPCTPCTPCTHTPQVIPFHFILVM